MEYLKIDKSNCDKVICTDNSPSLIEPNHTIQFFNKEHKELGKLDFNEDKLKFEGDTYESAQVFIDFLLRIFNQKIEQIKDKAALKAYENGYNDAYDYYKEKGKIA